MSNSREFNSGNKQMIRDGGPESLSKRGDGNGRELPKVLRSITLQAPVSLHGNLENDPFRGTRNQWRLTRASLRSDEAGR